MAILPGMRICAATAAMLLLAACATVQQAPKPPFDLDGSDSLTHKIRLTPEDIQSLLDATTLADRNRLLRRLIADIDLGYLGFAQALAGTKNHMGAVASLLGLGAGVASSLTASAGVKANYSSLGTLLTGTTAVVDNNYLFGQTTSALVSAMDDQRALVQVEIRRSMSQSLEEYPGQTAFADAIRYYRAGTLASATQRLQQIAANQAAESAENLREVRIPTDEEVAAAVASARSVSELIDDPANDKALRTVLIDLEVAGIDADSDHDALKAAAYAYLRAHRDRKDAFAASIRKAKGEE